MKLVISCGSKNWGGLEHMAELLARGLQARGHETVLFCRADSPLHQRLSGVVACEPILGGGDLHPGTIRRCVHALRRHAPQAVIANTVKDPRWTGIAARLLGIPVVYRQEIDEPYPSGWYHRLIYGWVPVRHVVNSEATRRRVLASVDWVAPEDVEVLPNGIDVDVLDRASPLDLALPAGSIGFGFLGRWETRKGIRELAEAWPQVAAAVPEAQLIIGGWGAKEEQFRSWLSAAPRVRWLGFRSDVPSLMKALDVLVAPSHYEGFGLVVVEAMGVGTPVISTSTSSIPELVSDGVEGRLVPPHDAAALAGAMIELARQPELRRRMGEAGRRRVRREFTVERMLDRHEELLAKVVEAARGAAPV